MNCKRQVFSGALRKRRSPRWTNVAKKGRRDRRRRIQRRQSILGKYMLGPRKEVNLRQSVAEARRDWCTWISVRHKKWKTNSLKCQRGCRLNASGAAQGIDQTSKDQPFVRKRHTLFTQNANALRLGASSKEHQKKSLKRLTTF